MTSIRSLAALDGTPTANVFPGAEPKTIRLTLAAGEEVPAHRHPGREIVLYLVDGRIELRLDGAAHEVTTDDVARFDGDAEIAPRAVEDSTALLVMTRRTTG